MGELADFIVVAGSLTVGLLLAILISQIGRK